MDCDAGGAAMFTLNASLAVYLHRDPIDFRQGINGLSALVEHALKLDPFGCACFAFSNKRRDRIKLLLWDRNGFWLCTKRLEAERFAWPDHGDSVISLTVQQLHWLLEGFDLAAMRGHRPVQYRHAG